MFSQIHSTWSANTLGVDISTVAGRLIMTGWPWSGRQTSVTALITSAAKSSSVPVKLSGEYWKVQSVSGWRAAIRSEEHTSELQLRPHLVCRLLLEKKKLI